MPHEDADGNLTPQDLVGAPLGSFQTVLEYIQREAEQEGYRFLAHLIGVAAEAAKELAEVADRSRRCVQKQ